MFYQRPQVDVDCPNTRSTVTIGTWPLGGVSDSCRKKLEQTEKTLQKLIGQMGALTASLAGAGLHVGHVHDDVHEGDQDDSANDEEYEDENNSNEEEDDLEDDSEDESDENNNSENESD